jgi:hypothetical protein
MPRPYSRALLSTPILRRPAPTRSTLPCMGRHDPAMTYAVSTKTINIRTVSVRMCKKQTLGTLNSWWFKRSGTTSNAILKPVTSGPKSLNLSNAFAIDFSGSSIKPRHGQQNMPNLALSAGVPQALPFSRAARTQPSSQQPEPCQASSASLSHLTLTSCPT